MGYVQAAGKIAEHLTGHGLAEAHEFEKFNQRYAFVTHDMKNLVSQLSLIVRNFEKHGDSPDFQRDMLATVQSVVERMNNLMARLSGEPDTAKIESVAIRPLIEAIIGEKCLANAAIMLDCPPDLSDLRVRADKIRRASCRERVWQYV